MNAQSKPDIMQRVEDSTAGEALYTIGEVAKLTGASTPTVRYYDKIGLLKPAEVTAGRYRLYTIEEIKRLELILTLRQLNFGISEIRKLMAGEVLISSAIDWQIEALVMQIESLTNVISILRQSKQSDYGEVSLQHIHRLVDALAVSKTELQKFLCEKLMATFVPGDMSEQWKEVLRQTFNQFLPNEENLTPLQTAALNEIVDLLEEPQFIKNRIDNFENVMNYLSQIRIDIAEWIILEKKVDEKMKEAIEKQALPDSPLVQAAIDERMRILSYAMQQSNTQELFCQYAKHCLSSATKQTKRLQMLLSILNPALEIRYEANELWNKGMQWRLERLEQG